jgi:hypothetical protein
MFQNRTLEMTLDWGSLIDVHVFDDYSLQSIEVCIYPIFDNHRGYCLFDYMILFRAVAR